MKKVFLIVFSLLLIVAAAVGIFAVTFNADSYRPFFQQKLQEALKKPVLIQKISLGWNGGIALEIDGLTILKDEKSQESLLRLEKASILVNAKPLLNRELQVSSIILESPEIDFTQTPSGQISAAVPSSGEPAGKSSEAVSAAAMTFLVDEILIRNGRIHYADPSSKSPVDISILDLDAAVRNISLTGPVDFDGKASLFSGEQNVAFQGKLQARGAGAIDIKDLLAGIQLEKMDTAKILKSLPSLQTVGLAQGLAGDAEVSVKKINILEGNVKELEGEAHLKGGRFKTAAMPMPFENAAVDMSFSLDHLALQALNGNFASGKLAASGLSQNLQSPQPQTQGEVSFTGLQVKDLAPPASEGTPYLEGIAAFNARGNALGARDIEIRQTLNGNARLTLKDGILRNMNILKEILDKLSMIPGVSKGLQSHLPQGYEKKLQERDTIFAPIDIPVTITQGNFFLEKGVVESQSFAVIASVKGDLAGNFRGEGHVVIEPELSQALIAGLNELRYITDSQGQLQIPFLFKGVNGKVSFELNINYVASKLASAKAQEVLSGFFQNKNADPNAQQGSSLYGQNNRAPYGQQGNQQTGGGLLGQLLSSAMQSQGSGE